MKINLTSRLLDEITISENASQKFKVEPFWEIYYHGEATALEFVLDLFTGKHFFNPHNVIEEERLHFARIDERARATNRLEHPAARNAAGWLSGLSIAERIIRVWEYWNEEERIDKAA